MKAKLVSEDYDFKRGLGSKESLGVGYEANFEANSEEYAQEIAETLDQLADVKIWSAHDRRDKPGMGNLLMESYMEYPGGSNYDIKGQIRIYKKDPRFRCTMPIEKGQDEKISVNTKDEFIAEFARQVMANQVRKIHQLQNNVTHSASIVKQYES
jgi:hypothetical protein